MQQDVHYCLIKILAQKSGFSPDDAQIIAYACQYVDDAVEYKPIEIKNIPTSFEFKDRLAGDVFDPICTAHKGIQYILGLKEDIQRKVYIPFHFLPDEKYGGDGYYDYCCVPDGGMARLLVERALKNYKHCQGDDKEAKIGALIQLGIALHTYADTWSHQGFSGRHSARDNDIKK